MLSALFFFYKTALAIWGLLWLQTHLRISVSTKLQTDEKPDAQAAAFKV